jgi:orotate phosphoribosyltransferase
LDYLEEKLIKWLFRTRSIKVCPENKPFFYTSGAIGPYYINTHYLYGSEKKAEALLKVINREKNNMEEFPALLLDRIKKNYKRTVMYRKIIDGICEFLKANINIDEVDYISGGERRDWFFSAIIADKLIKPHLFIYKDLSLISYEREKTVRKRVLKGKKILHIADLITEASSYERAWIPAVRDRGGEMKWSLSIVDRQQGGSKILENANVESYSLLKVNEKLFKKSMAMGEITFEQYCMLKDYINNPEESMLLFLKNNPGFLENALSGNEKTRRRAKLCMEKYNEQIG